MPHRAMRCRRADEPDHARVANKAPTPDGWEPARRAAVHRLMKLHRKSLLVAAVLAAGLGTAFGVKAYRYFGPYDAGHRMAAAAHAGDIQMYSYTTCGICRKAKRWFAFHCVPYQECYADRDAACNARFEALKTRGTPTFDIRGTVLQGFDPEQIALALERPAATAAAR